jgi:hypothetical protein
MLRLWIGRALLWLLLPAQVEQAERRGAWKFTTEKTDELSRSLLRLGTSDRQ